MLAIALARSNASTGTRADSHERAEALPDAHTSHECAHTRLPPIRGFPHSLFIMPTPYCIEMVSSYTKHYAGNETRRNSVRIQTKLFRLLTRRVLLIHSHAYSYTHTRATHTLTRLHTPIRTHRSLARALDRCLAPNTPSRIDSPTHSP
eukprot:6190576-Pleurochrysis_carterae.AAC.2